MSVPLALRTVPRGCGALRRYSYSRVPCPPAGQPCASAWRRSS
ncbi:hypothetical protein BOSE62_130869 [Bosea sp. 62]|nr:hypothetical protein BOSE7B_120901 [Bosea sp. 7B]CAD5285085.1 hypothetical protein BOSE46_50235 [Bosea sp. 46]VVT60251.1 hypothetical protein BOS5A_211042 [Bosea sp. EC-HK365B]VXB60960.1 hypothetical protein BOSE62_130869 [Bosea sp. 62]VXC23088.1 hypothetical protein BOSE127_170540 [Bosea sp. 127]